jgi:hypothetical protein
LAFFAISAYVGNRGLIAELRYGRGQATIDAVRRDTPDGAIVVAPWYDALTLGYGSAVEHALGSRIIIAARLDSYTDAYPRWARMRRVLIFTNIGAQAQIAGIPPDWLHPLPSSLRFYSVYEVLPR